MKKIVYTLFFLFAAVVAEAQDNEWQPISKWPFVYEKFQKLTTIYIGDGKQKLKTSANIHVGNSSLWYESRGKLLQAKADAINKIEFADGSRYYNVEGKICKLISEDSINGKIGRLYWAYQVDKQRFEEIVKANRQSSMMITDISPVLQSVASEVADNEGTHDVEGEPLPMQNKFYMLYNDEVFEVNEGNILKHLGSREERNAYRAFMRKAEVLYGSMRSVKTVWNTFFVK